MANHTVESLLATLSEKAHRQVDTQFPAEERGFLDFMLAGCDLETAWKVLAAFQCGQRVGLKWANDRLSSAHDQAGKENK